LWKALRVFIKAYREKQWFFYRYFAAAMDAIKDAGVSSYSQSAGMSVCAAMKHT